MAADMCRADVWRTPMSMPFMHVLYDSMKITSITTQFSALPFQADRVRYYKHRSSEGDSDAQVRTSAPHH
jgi:hypothetical protein